MKGITPVISIVLLLMITVALIGLAFVWFTKVWQTATAGVDIGIQTVTAQSQKIISIDKVSRDSTTKFFTVYVRNLGTEKILSSELAVYNKTLQAPDCVFPGGIPARTVKECTTTVSTCDGNEQIQVVGPSNTATGRC